MFADTPGAWYTLKCVMWMQWKNETMNVYTVSIGWATCFLVAIAVAAYHIVVPFFTVWFLFISLVGLAALISQAYQASLQSDAKVFSGLVGWMWMLGISFFYFQACFLHWTGFDSPLELFTQLAPSDSWPALLTRIILCLAAIFLMFCTRSLAASKLAGIRKHTP